jgi:hypothetical protein
MFHLGQATMPSSTTLVPPQHHEHSPNDSAANIITGDSIAVFFGLDGGDIGGASIAYMSDGDVGGCSSSTTGGSNTSACAHGGGSEPPHDSACRCWCCRQPAATRRRSFT